MFLTDFLTSCFSFFFFFIKGITFWLSGSIWIQFILLKTENWKYCNKIIFKYVNSVVGPIFNIFLNKVVVGPVNSARCLLKVEIRASKKEKKRKTHLFRFTVAWVPALIKRKHWTWGENANPNAHSVWRRRTNPNS